MHRGLHAVNLMAYCVKTVPTPQSEGQDRWKCNRRHESLTVFGVRLARGGRNVETERGRSTKSNFELDNERTR